MGIVTPSAVAQQQAAAAARAVGHFVPELPAGLPLTNASGTMGSGSDPSGLQEKAEFILREWVTLHLTAQGAKEPGKAFPLIITQVKKFLEFSIVS